MLKTQIVMDNKSNIFAQFLTLFTDVSYPSIPKENFTEVVISYTFGIQKIPSETNYDEILKLINSRDSLHLSVLKDDEIVENFTNRENKQFDEYVDCLKDNLSIGDEVEFIITIAKNKKDDTLSVYCVDEFIRYLSSLSFLTFINVIEKNLNGKILTLENQGKDLNSDIYITETIQLVNKKSDSKANENDWEKRKRMIDVATSLCHWDIEVKRNSLIPEDLYPINEQINPEIVEIFQKVSLLYTVMFIFDYLSIKEKTLSYKLNGYKTFGEEIITEKIENIKIDYKSAVLFYKIYQWIYRGGNTNDKISIARNIISLNYNYQTLELSKTSFDAIISNFKIYERQNVKQYIEVRNKLSEILIDLQGKIDKIVNGFIGDYKKNILTLLSFFISVIVIRAVSKGDFIGGFTTEIVILSYSFLLISIGIMFYSKWELKKRVSIFDKHYSQLRERYKELLSEDELERIFEDCNPKQIDSKSFIKDQEKLYTILWISSVIILTIAITLIYLTNNIQPLYLFCKILQLILSSK